jgi:hypothetical protein
MKEPSSYMSAAASLVLLSVLLTWAVAGSSSAGIALGVGTLAFVVQSGLFVLTKMSHGHETWFTKSWVFGILVRLGCIGAAGLVALSGRVEDGALLVLFSAGFLFVLHLLETAFLGAPVQDEFAG